MLTVKGLSADLISWLNNLRERRTRKVICSWCNEDMGNIEGQDGIEYGICKVCRDNELCEDPS